MDEFAENVSPGCNLKPGVIKIKLSGNNKIYCYIPYSNLSEETIKLGKGRLVGSLSLVDEITLVSKEQTLSQQKDLQNSQAFAMSHGSTPCNNNTSLVNIASEKELHDKQKDCPKRVSHEYIKKIQ